MEKNQSHKKLPGTDVQVQSGLGILALSLETRQCLEIPIILGCVSSDEEDGKGQRPQY